MTELVGLTNVDRYPLLSYIYSSIYTEVNRIFTEIHVFVTIYCLQKNYSNLIFTEIFVAI